jgi:hypothetical protein
MCVKWGLEWDSDKADVHSIHFSVGITIIGEMVAPNVKPKFKAREHIMKLSITNGWSLHFTTYPLF